ncbi:transcriptional regulator [Streptomyces azureus]|uniref:Transcriptional regulator n=1 Tax=Streptomyces azureus TaxID=146537 RepID=A0A0K8PU50_STRAJ|nr:transcriptional regulator [Streptomyces azureus]
MAGGLEPLASAAVDADARDRQTAIEGVWHRDLVALLAEGISRGEFRSVDPDRFAARLRALLTGFAIHVAIGLRGTDRAQALRHVHEFLADSLSRTPELLPGLYSIRRIDPVVRGAVGSGEPSARGRGRCVNGEHRGNST